MKVWRCSEITVSLFVMKTIISLLCAAALAASCTPEVKVSTVSVFPTETESVCYQSNRAPLQREQLIKLPTGSIKPAGWLLRQLELQKDGLNGHLGEISIWLSKDDNAWLTDGGAWGWEEVPYWLRGYSSLSYIFEDEAMLAESKLWIDAILNSQLPSGNFGPSARGLKPGENQDFWPNMIALWILQDWYEFSGDERVIPFMTRYCEYLLSVPDENLLESYWENSRGGDNLWSVVWLYNRTGDERLIGLGEKLHQNTADWTNPTDLPNWHNVNIAQGIREPATYYLFNGRQDMLQASYNSQDLIRRTFGQVPGGMFGGDENCRLGYIDPRQGTETCGFAEQMASDEIMALITADEEWFANCEDIAFNDYPAAFMPDYKSLRYLTCPNMAVSDSENHRPSIDNGGPFLAMNPFSSRCCQHNHGFAWPYYSEFLAMATPDNGLAFGLYSACVVSAKVGAEATEITLLEETEYPFEESVKIRVANGAAEFPLYVRIPGWCDGASVLVNGKTVAKNCQSGTFACLEKSWKEGDEVEVKLPMSIKQRVWAVNQNSVSVDYGPLTLSLQIAEEYKKVDSKETAIHDSRWQEGADAALWPSYEIYPKSAWNYALATDADIVLERGTWPEDDNPFTLDSCPLHFKAKGRLVPSWGFDETGLTGVLPAENALKADQLDDITLVPMGAARLRISAFPACSSK